MGDELLPALPLVKAAGGLLVGCRGNPLEETNVPVFGAMRSVMFCCRNTKFKLGPEEFIENPEFVSLKGIACLKESCGNCNGGGEEEVAIARFQTQTNIEGISMIPFLSLNLLSLRQSPIDWVN